MIVPLEQVLILAAVIFVMGLACLLVRRGNLIMMLVGIEIMLNAAILAFVGGSAAWGKMDGQVFALFIIAMTSAEVSLWLWPWWSIFTGGARRSTQMISAG